MKHTFNTVLKCDTCGRAFLPTSGNHHYCSARCRGKAYRELEKPQKILKKKPAYEIAPARKWTKREPDGVPEKDIWYHPAQVPDKPPRPPRVVCNVSALPVPRLPPTRPPVRRAADISSTSAPKPQDQSQEKNLGGRPRTYTDAQDSVIRTMKAEGASFKQIGEQIGKSTEAVRRRWYRLEGYC